MNNNDNIKVVIAESSIIIRSGITAVLKRLPNFSFAINEISSYDTLQIFIRLHTPDIIIINPLFTNKQNISSLKKEFTKLKIVALLSNFIDTKSLSEFDDIISIFDDTEIINNKLSNLFKDDEEDDNSETEQLSTREKEIIGFVVKGMTNKAIADKLSISIHTVITHRRNIAKKLQIHSSAGLAIYAIVNKIVEIQDIKENL